MPNSTVNTTSGNRPQFNFLVGCYLGSMLIVFLDQLSKYMADASLEYGMPKTVFTGFDLLLTYNRGAAFSFLSDAGGWQRWFFTIISLVISVVIAVWISKVPKQQKLLLAALVFILGGALGNLFDRLFLGYVIDFISVYYGQYRFATFNLADSAISVGAALMILDIVLHSKSNEEESRVIK